MLHRVSKIENGSGGEVGLNQSICQSCYLWRVSRFMVVLLPFLLFCSSWLDSVLHRHLLEMQKIWNTSPLLAPDSCLRSFSPVLVKLALSVCTTGAERLLQLNFMLSRTSDIFLFKTQTIKSSAFSSFSLSVLLAPFRLSFRRSAALIRLLERRD